MKKYVRNVEEFVLFPDTMLHSDIAKLWESIDHSSGLKVISAGFYHNGICFGESISLGIKSLPEDTEELKKWLD